jgi:excisionase family DNA binding protein
MAHPTATPAEARQMRMNEAEDIMQAQYVSPAEAATLLGVSLRTVYRMLDDGQLDHIRLRSLYRIPKVTLYATADTTPGGDA